MKVDVDYIEWVCYAHLFVSIVKGKKLYINFLLFQYLSTWGKVKWV